MIVPFVRLGTAAAFLLALAGCGGSGSSDAPPPAPTVKESIATAAAVPANDTSTNSSASFTVLQDAGLPAVTVNSPPVVNFTVFSNGAVVQGLTNANVRFAIAKLVPGVDGEIDKWASYIYRTESTTAPPNNGGPNGKPVLASAKQATTDANTPAQLVYNPDGYYTYTFATDIKDPTKTNGVVFEPGLTHRVAIQLSYKNAAGETVLVNPYYDFTVDANGNSVTVTDPAKTRKMADVASCNGCHDKLALHGGGRVDVQFCVMCHNPGTTDANSGNVLTMATMTHKIHAGRKLAEEDGENYTIWGFGGTKHDYAEVGFPQPIRNCARCHDGSNPLTPQGDNWKNRATKEACLTCHSAKTGGTWETFHVNELKLGTSGAAISNSTCAKCHGSSGTHNAEKAHWVQEMANAALYEGRIAGATLTKRPTATAAGVLSVTYSVANPATGAAYNLREGCSAAATTDQAGNPIVGCNTNYRWDAVLPPTPPGKPQDKFGTFSLYVAANTLKAGIDDTTTTTNVSAYRGVDNGSRLYTANLTVPAGATGNLRVVMTGSVAERRIDPILRAPVGAVPPTKNSDLAYVPVKNAIFEFDLDTGATSAKPRRQIVSNDTCNTCHGILGVPLSADPEKPGFHKGVRNNSESCEICHNASLSASYTFMTDGSLFDESYQAKRMVHGIHGGTKRTYPFTHCNNVVRGEIGKDGKRLSDGVPLSCTNYPGATQNFTAEVSYPGRLQDCTDCHVKNSWKQDRGLIGSVVSKPAGVTDPLRWLVISPKAASCTSCHDSKSALTHVTSIGGASFGTLTQSAVLAGTAVELCEGCHAPGAVAGIDVKHGLK